MRMYIGGVGAALAGFVIAVSPPAMASTLDGAPDTTVDWQQEFCLTDCSTTQTSSPITQIDIIMASGNASFNYISPTLYTTTGTGPVGTGALLNQNNAVINFNGAGDSADVYVTLGFTPDPASSDSFTFYWEQFDGSTFIATGNPVTSSDVVSWNGSSWTITPMTAPVSTTPLPSTAPLFAAGLGLLAFMAYWRKKRTGLDREGAHQFA
jgi:hypothetical protein